MTSEEIAPPATRRAPAGTIQTGSTVQAANWWSIERVLYGVALLIGIWLRFWTLGAQPLSPWEASNSWPAWLVANGLHVVDAPTPVSALYYNLQWLLFWLGVNSDAGARFVSAIAGSALIILPWWWRGTLGRRVALLAAFLIALDAWLVCFSRLADGAGLAITLGMLALVSLSQVAAQPQHLGWRRTAATSFGLLLVAGPMGWNMLPVVLLWGWQLRAKLSAAQLWQRQWIVWAAGAAILGATLGLARMDGLAWLASGMSVWLAQFDGHETGPLLPMITGGFDFWWPWLRLWADASLLGILGLGGLVWLGRRLWLRERHDRDAAAPAENVLVLGGGWLIWGLMLVLLPGRSPLALPMLGLPLLLFSAFALDALIRTVPRDLDWREASAVILTLCILLVSGLFWLTALLASRNYDPVLAQAALVIFGLAVAIVVAFGVWANRRDAAWIAAALVASLLVLVEVRSGWKLNFGDVDAEPAGWQSTVTHPEMRLLVDDMQTLSAHRAGDPYQLPVQVQVAAYATQDEQTVPARPDPVVGWELRNMRNLTWVTAPQVAEDTTPLPLVLTPVSGDDASPSLDIPDTYAGSRYHVDAWWLPRTLIQADAGVTDEGESNVARLWARALQPWWRWFVYREPTLAPQTRDVILWAPLDITQPQQ